MAWEETGRKGREEKEKGGEWKGSYPVFCGGEASPRCEETFWMLWRNRTARQSSVHAASSHKTI